MLQLIANHISNPEVSAVYRFNGFEIYLKYTGLDNTKDIINKLQRDNCKVFVSRNGWIKVVLPKNEEFKIGNLFIDPKSVKFEELNNILSEFFEDILIKGGFKTEIGEI